MTTYSPIVPGTNGTAAPVRTAAAGDQLNPASKLLIIVENGSGSSNTLTLEDVRTTQPAGATASTTFADLPIVTAAGARSATIVRDVSRFIDPATGLISLTWSATTTITWNAYEVA